MSDTDFGMIAWAAGFLEGEGFFQRGRWVMGANQVNREPLERLQTIFGGRIFHRKNPEPPRKPWYGWELTGRNNVITATELIWPWLSEDRKQRIPWSEHVVHVTATPIAKETSHA